MKGGGKEGWKKGKRQRDLGGIDQMPVRLLLGRQGSLKVKMDGEIVKRQRDGSDGK